METTFFQPESEFYPLTPQNGDKKQNAVYLKSVRKETVLQGVIKDRSIEMKKIDWQACEWFQPKSLKECMEVDFNKLVSSLQENEFADPLKVWGYAPGKIKILDGHHRQKALEYCRDNDTWKKEPDGEPMKMRKPPRLLNAIFMDCKNEKEAAKLCLIYAAEYAKIQDHGLHEFLNTFSLEFDDIKTDVEFPGINLDSFEECYYKEYIPPEPDEIKNRDVTQDEIEKKASELAKKMLKEQVLENLVCPKCGHEFKISG